MAVSRVQVLLPAYGAARSYPIVVDPDVGAELRLAEELASFLLSGASVAILTDETVAGLHLPRVHAALTARGLRAVVGVVPDGEASKSLSRVAMVAEQWSGAGLDRRTVVLALGGGVVGDLAGFVASVYLRGVACVQAPTTLLAQVDSSVGGKTGVNLPAGKNLVGTFQQPILVYADVTALATLTRRDLAAGLAEVVKHGAILDADLFALLERRADEASAGAPALLAELVERSCRIKAQVVAQDERETAAPTDGGRALLNFGHTVGHALESASVATAAPLRHGEAVALGMVAALRVGAALGAPTGAFEGRLLALLERLGLPTDLDRRLDPGVLARLAVDKKRTGTHLSFVILDAIGKARLVPVTADRVCKILLGEKPK